MAGIGRVDASNEHLAAQSAGILKISSPSDMGDGEYVLFGHDKGDITTWTTAEAPNAGTNIERLAREWRLDETGDVGTVSVGIDTTDLPARPAGYTKYFLLVDADGNFSSGATSYAMTSVGGSNYEASGVAIADGNYVTIAVVRSIIEFTSTNASKFEPQSPATMQISLSYPLSTNTTVDYTVTGGTATSGSDYVFSNGTATITAGNTTTNLNIVIINDVVVESDETMIVTLSNPSAGVTIGTNASDTLRINDDDNSRKVSFRTTTGTSDEAVTPATATVQINSVDGTNPTTVGYKVTGGTATSGSDYVLAAGIATIPAGEDSITFDIAITDDATYENSETIVVSLYNPSNCNLNSSNTTFTYTITDNDSKPTVEFAQTTSSQDEGTSPALIAVVLSAATGTDVTVDYAITGGSASGSGVDYTLVDGTLTIAAGDTTADISVDIVDDGIVESEETFEITLSNPTNADPGTDLVTTVTINDDDNDGYVGPGGVGDDTNNKIWLSANDAVYSDAGSTDATNGGSVQEWHDRSGNGNNATQTTAGSKPTLATSSINGQSVLTFDGSSDWMSIVTGDIPETNYTEFVIFKSSDATGPFTTIASPATYSGGAHDRQFGLSSNKMSSRIYNTEVISTASDYNDNAARIAELQVTTGVGQEIFINEASVKTGTKGGSDFNWESGMVIGGHTAWGYYAGSIAEVILYNKVLNDAQQIIVNNYLSSKYGITIVNDKFSYDGVHLYDVAGIGREDASNMHTAAESAGILRVSNASGMGNGEYLLFGHDNGDITAWTTTEAPTVSGSSRLAREWRVDETGDVGTVTVTIDTATFPAVPVGYQMMLAVDGDGDFTSGAVLYPLIYTSGTEYAASGIDFSAGDYVAVVAGENITKQSGDFDDPATWLVGIVPGTGENAIINTGHVVDLTANQSIGSLTINGTLNLNSKTLTVDQGTITNNGTFDAGTGKVIYSASGDQCVTPLTYYKLSLAGSGTKTLCGNIDVNSDLNVTASGVSLDVSASDYGINLAGKWNNSGTFVPRSGTVVFDGTGTQNLTATVAQTYTNVTINKASGYVKMLRNIEVDGTLTMTNGNLQLGSFDLTFGTSGTISGGSASSYIEADGIGVLKKLYNAVPAAAFAMPMGDANEYAPFTFTLQDGTLSGLSYVTFKQTDSKHPSLSGTTDYISRYWTVSASGISCNGTCDDGAGDINFDASYTYQDADVNGTEAYMIPMKYTLGSWTADGSVNTGTNTLSWSGVPAFGDMTGANASAVLPIGLLSFNVWLERDVVRIEWVTAAEINNNFFTVERSHNGIDFEAIENVKGAGNSNRILTYRTYDTQPLEGLSYYRLTQTDYDGQSETFDLVPVRYLPGRSGQHQLSVFPNPAKDKAFVVLEGMEGNSEVTVVVQDMLGKVFRDLTIQADPSGNAVAEISQLNEMHPGVYLVTVRSSHGVDAIRLIVDRN
ncbi:MAG: T9SS type A sorting domain-containing protein [Flavobacteriales bacterium]|nr:T9SS type A sorting domain-containing protein [Flavobacteriales bacterium]